MSSKNNILFNKEKKDYAFSALVSKWINLFKNPEKLTFNTILVIKNDEIGDLITILPSITQLHLQLPNASFTLLSKPFGKMLLQDQSIFSHFVTSIPHGIKYDLILDLRGDFSTAKFALTAACKYRLDRGTVRIKNKLQLDLHPHEVYANWQILEPLIGPAPKDVRLNLLLPARNLNSARLFIERNVIDDFVVFHTGARKKLKRWHPLKFAQLAEYFYNTKKWNIIFVGDSADIPNIEKIRQNTKVPTFSFAGIGNLMDYAALVSMSKLMIGNDSGPMHIASACNVPVIGLFGPGEPHLYSPFGNKSDYIHHKLACNPCDQENCVLPQNPCINHIEVEEVINKVNKLLN